MVFGSQHSCLEFRFRYWVQTLALHVLSRCVSVPSRVRSAACSSVHVCCVCVAHSLCISLAAYFHVVMSCVNTRLMSFLISCVFSVLFCTWLVNCLLAMCLCFHLCEHVAFVLVFCVSCALVSIVLTSPILLPYYWLICPTCVYLSYPPHLLPL